MNQFLLKRGYSRELQLFPHIAEIGLRKNTSIQLNAFPERIARQMHIYYVFDGKFEWNISGNPVAVYPKDVVWVLPGERVGSANGCMDIGTFVWLYVDVDMLNNRILPASRSAFTESESQAIGNVLMMNKSTHLPLLSEVGRIFQHMQAELFNQEIGYFTRVNQLLDELLIIMVRQLTRQNNSGRDFPKKFLHLEQMLRQNLAHQWTVEEMAASVGMGTTLFNERVKNYSGFSPLTYLINLRISEAIKLLKTAGHNITNIALDTGFYSSQHFSTTFKKLTGYTPSEFRRKNTQGD
jgi:AraC-like DNA-binding protein